MLTPSRGEEALEARLILAAAAYFEAAETIEVLKKMSVSFTFLEVGVGAIDSAIIAAKLRSLVVNRPVLFIGSCGTSNQFDAPYLNFVAHVKWAPQDVRSSMSYLVSVTNKTFELTLPDKLDLPSIELSCASSISKSYFESNDVFENLELYSVASAWLPSCKSMTSIMGVTNQIGPNAHHQWRSNFKNVSNLTANYVSKAFTK